jgi:hypothetical protein
MASCGLMANQGSHISFFNDSHGFGIAVWLAAHKKDMFITLSPKPSSNVGDLPKDK